MVVIHIVAQLLSFFTIVQIISAKAKPTIIFAQKNRADIVQLRDKERMTDLMPIIRVRRKRSADPRAALIMETKKRKDDPLLFSLFKTDNDNEGIDGIKSGVRVIDFKADSSEVAAGRGLEFIGELNEPGAGPSDDPMGDRGDVEEPVGYDYYKIYRGSMTEPIREWDADVELRFATEEEQTLLLGNSDSESDCAADDDDDSNDENNWRNDYPEEEDDDTEDEDVNYYDDDDREFRRTVHEDNDESPFALEGMRRRLEGFAMEAYEGEEDNSDDDDDYLRGNHSGPSNDDDDSYDDRYRED
ncbi:hypothetical protein RB195_003022 [Necator americanus]